MKINLLLFINLFTDPAAAQEVEAETTELVRAATLDRRNAPPRAQSVPVLLVAVTPAVFPSLQECEIPTFRAANPKPSTVRNRVPLATEAQVATLDLVRVTVTTKVLALHSNNSHHLLIKHKKHFRVSSLNINFQLSINEGRTRRSLT